MSSGRIHDAVLCAERRGRTPARSIGAAIVKEPRYGRYGRLANATIDHAFHNRACVPRRLIEEWAFARVCALLENVILRGRKSIDQTVFLRPVASFCIESCTERRKLP